MREPVTHELKIWPEYFLLVSSGRKRFEVRYNDRDYQEGDFLRLREFDPALHMANEPHPLGNYTGRAIRVQTGYIFGIHGEDVVDFGLRPGYVVMQLVALWREVV